MRLPVSKPVPNARLQRTQAGRVARSTRQALALLGLAALLALVAASARAQGPAPGASRTADAAQWELETLTLKDGQVYRGLLLTGGDEELEFAEIFRAPGRPMSAAIRVVEPERVKVLERLPEPQRELLAARFHQFKHRAGIEAGRMESVQLRQVDRQGVTWHVYDGRWFTLASTAGEEATRRCVVRIEQIFRAYRQFLPPRVDAQRRLVIRLRGSLDEYRGELRRWGLNVENPAVYALARNTILAGSDLSSFSERLAQVRQQHTETLRRWEQLGAEFRQRLEGLAGELERAGVGREAIRDELALRRAVWKTEHDATVRRINQANRRNDDKFAEATARLFSRLYHEAFHAYLENYVFPHDQFYVPRWLNEGLAQIFEHGQLEADTLRVDAAAPQLLAPLRADLAGGAPLPLAQLLASPPDAFLGAHLDRISDRRYLYAWGLAHFLVFEQDVLYRPELERYLARDADGQSAAQRFEQLVGSELRQFEQVWREEMIKESRVQSRESRAGKLDG